MIQIVIPPGQSGGVFDFAMKLREQMGQDSARVIQLSKANAVNWNVGARDVVFLQLSGYGFQRRGAPLWLLHEIQARRKSIKTLGIFFHELYAFGPPWSSSFWLSPVQRYIASELVQLCDFWMTNREGSARWLLPRAPGKLHQVLPVFSNVGEIASYKHPRAARIVVFGGPGQRQLAYRTAGQSLFDWAKRTALELHDVGLPLPEGDLAHTLRAQGAILHGRQDEKQVSDLLAGSAFGLVAYTTNYVAKSSIFASYCAHGVCPVLVADDYAQADGLLPGVHYIAGIPSEDVAVDSVQGVGKAAWDWYQPHSLRTHVNVLRRFARIGEQ
jgi:hypothetical protein